MRTMFLKHSRSRSFIYFVTAAAKRVVECSTTLCVCVCTILYPEYLHNNNDISVIFFFFLHKTLSNVKPTTTSKLQQRTRNEQANDRERTIQPNERAQVKRIDLKNKKKNFISERPKRKRIHFYRIQK